MKEKEKEEKRKITRKINWKKVESRGERKKTQE